MQLVEVLDSEFRGDHVALPGRLGIGAGHVAEDADLDCLCLRAGDVRREQCRRADGRRLREPAAAKSCHVCTFCETFPMGEHNAIGAGRCKSLQVAERASECH